MLNGFLGDRARIHLPLTGAWTADVAIDPGSSSQQIPLEGSSVTLQIGEGGQTFVGAVRRVNNAFDTVYLRLVGGAGGLPLVIPAKTYRSMTFGAIASDILKQVGEQISTTVAAGIQQTPIANWSILNEAAGLALANLVDEAAILTGNPCNWRVLVDGTIWIGQETWPASPIASYDLMSWSPQQLATTIFAENPNILPGQTWQSANVVNVEHLVEPELLRTKIWYDDTP